MRGQGESRGPGVAIAEQVVTQVQVAPGSDAVREATRGAGAAVASSTSASTLEKITSIMRMVTPSAAMCDLLVSWGQFTAIFGDLTQQVTHELGRDFPNFLIPNWATQLDGIWPVVKVFNLDIRALQAHLDFAFLAAIGWRETHLAFTVLVPLIISGVTIVLLRSLADIARLILFTLSVLLLVFGAAAYAILGLASSTRGEETTEILDLNTTVLAYVMVTGGCGLFLSIVLFFTGRTSRTKRSEPIYRMRWTIWRRSSTVSRRDCNPQQSTSSRHHAHRMRVHPVRRLRWLGACPFRRPSRMLPH